MARASRRDPRAAVARAHAKMTRGQQVDEECRRIAQLVYRIAFELKHDDEPEPLPLAVLAPLMAAAETVAPGAARLANLPNSEEMAREVAAYLISGFREMAVMLDREHFEQWRRSSNEAAGINTPGSAGDGHEEVEG